jgi:hypothetical protein
MCLATHTEVAYESTTCIQRPSRVRHVIGDDEPRVTFRLEAEVHVVSTALSFLKNRQELQQIWYSKNDIKKFRHDAQCLSKRLRDDPQFSADEHTRGLELRSSLQRQDRKQLVVKKILEAQNEACTKEELAQISLQHSAWSRKLAVAQAHKDFYAAYHPNLSSVLPAMPALLDCSRDLANNNKRSLRLGTSLEPSGRRVRCRIF